MKTGGTADKKRTHHGKFFQCARYKINTPDRCVSIPRTKVGGVGKINFSVIYLPIFLVTSMEAFLKWALQINHIRRVVRNITWSLYSKHAQDDSTFPSFVKTTTNMLVCPRHSIGACIKGYNSTSIPGVNIFSEQVIAIIEQECSRVAVFQWHTVGKKRYSRWQCGWLFLS